MENKKTYIVTAVDTNDSADGVPEKLGQFCCRHEAEDYVREDMREYCDNYTFVDDNGETVGPRVYDETKMYIENFDGSASCQWAIIEVDAPQANG